MRSALIIVLTLIYSSNAFGQVFGQNKPLYDRMDFEVYRTPHFDIYHYLSNDSLKSLIADNAERWYNLHRTIFRDTFDFHNPIILYNDHPDFQQTTTISGAIGEGTGGVTESLKNRVVFPMMFSNQQTGHVLGHELVHAFQYHLIQTFNQKVRDKMNGPESQARGTYTRRKGKKADSLEVDSAKTVEVIGPPMDMGNIPLWMVEGMAEYLSIGREDPYTAMWMRDAVANESLPTLKDLNDYSKYFPYRWGQAFWAFVVSRYGEEMVRKLFIETGQYGLKAALVRNTGQNMEEFSKSWADHLRSFYQIDNPADSLHKKERHTSVLVEGDRAKYHVAPAISHNGQFFVFISERDIFNMDLYLGQISSGKVIKQITSINNSGYTDAVASVEAIAAWSPDNRHIAYVAFSKGKNILVVQDVFSEKSKRSFFLKGVPAFTNPAWSPDGKYILVSGLVNGQVDLFVMEVKTGRVERLTNDFYSEVMPSWSSDGHKIIYSTDRLAFGQGKTLGNLTYDIEILDLDGPHQITNPIRLKGNQLNAVFGEYNNEIWFLSNHDGFRNLYRYDLLTDKLFRETQYWTGVSGITEFSPAFSLSANGDVIYSLYEKNGYQLHLAKQDSLLHTEVSTSDTLRWHPGVLPIDTLDVITKGIRHINGQEISKDSNQVVSYEPKFELDYIGGEAGVGIATSSMGTASGLNGGVNMLMSDILGFNTVFVGASLNGELQDFAIQSAYINERRRLPWGIGLSHIPYLSGASAYMGREPFLSGEDTLSLDHFIFDRYRTFQDQLSAVLYYPLNVANRFELGSSFSLYYSQYKRYHVYYLGSYPMMQKEEKLPGFSPKAVGEIRGAYVHDHSRFGLTSPGIGARYRIEASQYFGAYSFSTLSADYRKYWFLKPVTIAFRGMHYGRYGDSGGLSSLFIGYPGLVRGYSFSRVVDGFQEQYEFLINRLVGNKIGLSSFEVRLPLSGPERLAIFRSRFLYSDIALFFDAGVAWTNNKDLAGLSVGEGPGGTPSDGPMLAASTGLSYRINVGGSVIFETYFAIPLNKNFKPGIGVNILPGW